MIDCSRENTSADSVGWGLVLPCTTGHYPRGHVVTGSHLHPSRSMLQSPPTCSCLCVWCVPVCACVSMCASFCACAYVFLCVRVFLCMHAYFRVYMCVSMCSVCAVFLCFCVCMCVHVCFHVFHCTCVFPCVPCVHVCFSMCVRACFCVCTRVCAFMCIQMHVNPSTLDGKASEINPTMVDVFPE